MGKDAAGLVQVGHDQDKDALPWPSAMATKPESIGGLPPLRA